MKNLTDEELLNLASNHIDIMEKNLSINKLLMVVLIIEAVLFFTKTISPESYCIFVIPCWIIYLIHYFKYKKSMKVVEDILEEINNR